MITFRRIPPAAGRWLKLAAITLALVTLSVAGLIAAGFFDPQPAGRQRLTLPLSPLSLSPTADELIWLDLPPLPDNFSLRLTAGHRAGDMDAAYGLVIGQESQAVAILLSPLGYAAIQQIEEGEPAGYLLPWQPWPHVKSGQADNEIWLDMIDGEISVRINRELLWRDAAPTSRPYRAGLIGSAFGDAAIIQFHRIEIFTPAVWP